MKRNFNFLCLSLGIILFACNPNHEGVLEDEAETNSFFVSMDLASDIASDMSWPMLVAKTKSSLDFTKDVKSVEIVPGEGSDILFYVINYEDKGFLLLSADKRNDPILAYSEENSFDLANRDFPPGLVSWVSDTKEKIEYEKKTKTKENPMWESVIKNKLDISTRAVTPPTYPDPDEIYNRIYYYVDFPMQWGQERGYNSLLPEKNCTNSGFAYAGCGIIAMATIMKYHKYPTNYNWSGMPNTSATTTTASFIKDVFNAAKKDYDCGGTSTNEASIIAGFKKFGYNHVTCSDLKMDIVRGQLEYGRPVILSGGRNNGWWIFNNYTDGHAWVCNGYHSWEQGMAGYLKYHMKWGWYGTYDGWYGMSTFNPGNSSFNYKNRVYCI